MKVQYGFIGLFILVLVACTHKELCRDHRHPTQVMVQVNWPTDLDTSGMYLRLLLYPLEGGQPLIHELGHVRGGLITVPSGDYHALLLNVDPETVYFRNMMDYGRMEAFVEEYPWPEARLQLLHEPDPLWSDHLETVHINSCLESQILVFEPKPILSRYMIVIRNLGEILPYIQKLWATVDGLSSGYRFETQESLADTGIYGTQMIVPDDPPMSTDACAQGGFLCFGIPSGSWPPHIATVYMKLKDGRKFLYREDVTLQILESEHPRNVLIVLDGFPEPVPIDANGGFDPDVDGWQEVRIELPI